MGHAIEAMSLYTLGHGHAVSIGMAGVTRYQVDQGEAKPEVLERLLAWCQKVNLPTENIYPLELLEKAILHDKKREEGSITFLLPFGDGEIRRVKVALQDIRSLLDVGFGEPCD